MKRFLTVTAILLIIMVFSVTAAYAEDEASIPYFEDELVWLQVGETYAPECIIPEGYTVESALLSFQRIDCFGPEAYAYWADETAHTGLSVDGEMNTITALEPGRYVAEYRFNGSAIPVTQVIMVETPEAAFTVEETIGGIGITRFDASYLGASTGDLVIPRSINGKTVTQIGEEAFSGAGIKCLYIPEGVVSIGDSAFDHCTWLSGILFPDALTSIGTACFESCISLEYVYLPEGIDTIPDRCFGGCLNLRSVYCAADIRYIGYRAFCSCNQLEEPDAFPALEYLGEEAFAATALHGIDLPETLTAIPAGVFANCRNFEGITFSSELISIGDNAFSGCIRLQYIEFPPTLEYIGKAAFKGCSILPDMLTEEQPLPYVRIDDEAFADCTAFTDIYLSAGAGIGESVFTGALSVKSIRVEAGNAGLTADGTALYSADGTRLLFYAPASGSTSYALPETVTDITPHIFNDIAELEYFAFNTGFTAFEDTMFRGCASLRSVAFTGGISVIPPYFFDGCSSLETMTGIDGLSEIGAYAFRSSGIHTLALPDELSVIGIGAFEGSALETFTVPSAAEKIEAYTFRDCTSLASVVFHEGMTAIGTRAFSGSGLTEVTIPALITVIPSGAFDGCRSLEKIDLSGVHSLSVRAFADCISLTDIEWSASLSTVGTSAFEGCSALETVELPLSVVELSSYAFADCIGLESVCLGDAVMRIGSRAFAGCILLDGISIPPSVTDIGSDAFSGCSAGFVINAMPGSAAQIYARSNGIAFAGTGEVFSFIDDPMGDGVLISGCEANVVALDIPASYQGSPVTGIVPGAFYGCNAVSRVSVPEGSAYFSLIDGVLYSADRSELLYYPAAKENAGFTVPEHVTAIADYAFAGCRIGVMTIPEQVISIGDHAFAEVRGVLSVVPDSYAETWAEVHSAEYINGSGGFSYVIEGGKAVITGYAGNAVSVTIPSYIDGYEVTSIRRFENAYTKNVTVAEGIRTIEYGAFRALGANDRPLNVIETVSLPDSLETIDNGAFDTLPSLREISFGSGLKTIGAHAFSGTGLTDISLPESLESVDLTAFDDTHITELYIPSKVSSFTNALYGIALDDGWPVGSFGISPDNPYFEYESPLIYDKSTGIVTLCLPHASGSVAVKEGTLSIGRNAFAYRSGISEILLPEGLEDIGDCAFSYCTDLTRINVPESVETIGYQAFFNCTGLSAVSIPNVVKLNDQAFAFSSLRSIELSAELDKIADSAFDGCTELENVSIPSENMSYAARDGIVFEVGTGDIVLVTATVSGEIDIPYGVTGIKDYGFYGLTGISGIAIPDTVDEVGFSAFEGCAHLTQVSFGTGLRWIGDRAFSGTGLTSLYIPGTVEYIGDSAFSGCPELGTIELGEGITAIGRELVFSRCESLTCVILPSTLTDTGNWTFANDISLTEISLPGALDTLGSHCFSRCSSLGSISFSGTKVGSYALEWCTSLKTAYMPNAVDYGQGVFANCEQLEEIEMTASSACASIPDQMFYRCRMLTEVTGLGHITSVGREAFFGCFELDTDEMTAELERVGDHAFAYCGKLDSVTLSERLTCIGANAFRGTALRFIDIPAGCEEIGNGAFAQCTLLEEVSLSGTDVIGEGAFTDCSVLRYVDLSRCDISVVPKQCFENCAQLETVLLPHVRQIGEAAFCECPKLKTVSMDSAHSGVYLPYVTEEIGERVFCNCIGIESFAASDALVSIGTSAFDHCRALRSVYFGGGLTYIGDRAFDCCDRLGDVIFESPLESIGEYAFLDCRSITELDIPDTVEEIGAGAFAYCTSLVSLHLPSGLTEIPDRLAGSCMALEHVDIPDNIHSVGDGAFEFAYSLASVSLPATVTAIGSKAFSFCYMYLFIPSSVTRIADDAFENSRVTVYAPAGSAALTAAAGQGQTCSAADAMPSDKAGVTVRELAERIVRGVVTDDMTDYEKVCALLQWIKDECELRPLYYSDIPVAMPLLSGQTVDHTEITFGYKALLDAAGVCNDIAGGGVSSEYGGGMGITYFGECISAYNAVCIDGCWYFTSAMEAATGQSDRFFMANRAVMEQFWQRELPEYDNIDGYEYCYAWRDHDLAGIAGDIQRAAQESFDNGLRLYSTGPVSRDVIDGPDAADLLGRYLDSRTWMFGDEVFEAGILLSEDPETTGYVYWIYNDLSGEHIDIVPADFNDGAYLYGEMIGDGDYMAEYYGYPLGGSLVSDGPITSSGMVTMRYIPLIPQLFGECDVQVNVICELPDHDLTASAEMKCTGYMTVDITSSSMPELPDDWEYVFEIHGAQDDIIYHAELEGSADMHVTADMPLSGDIIAMIDAQCSISVTRQAEDCASGKGCEVILTVSKPAHHYSLNDVSAAREDQDGYIGELCCDVCGTVFIEDETIASSAVMRLPAALSDIEAEAFACTAAQQIEIPFGTCSIGDNAFAGSYTLRLVIVPGSVTHIGGNAFGNDKDIIMICTPGSTAYRYAVDNNIAYMIMQQ